MQSAAVPCTSNGIKRTAASALLSSESAAAAASLSMENHASTTTTTTSSNSTNINAGGGGGGGGSSHSSSSSTSSSSRDHDQSISPPPPEKRSFIVIESPLKLGTIAGAEDLDIRVLRIQNKNLSERLVQRQKLEAELRDKIESLQNRKAADDSKICIFDRYWTQLDEDLRLMLERFDAAVASESSADPSTSAATATSSKAVRNFLGKLNDWDRAEVEEKLKERVKFTTQTVSKLVSNYDRLLRKFESYHKELSQEKMETDSNDDSPLVVQLRHQVGELSRENCKLNQAVTQCQQKEHLSGIEYKQLEDKIVQLENEIKELNNKNDEMEYELDKTRDKAFRLDRQLADSLTKLSSMQKAAAAASLNSGAANNSNHAGNSHADQNGHNCAGNNNSNNNSNQRNADAKMASLTDKQLVDLESDLEEQRELAASRLQELEKLNVEYQSALKHIEKLKSDLKTIPESVVEQTNEYKNLQTKYSLIVSDNMKLKQVLDETRNLMEMSRVQFTRQLEQMESDDLAHQKRLIGEMVQLEEQLAQIRKENEMLRIEYEQNVAANEQTGPINKEMRSLITTLQTNNKLLKSDSMRCKKRLEEVQLELQALKKQHAQLQQQQAAVKREPVDEKVVKTEPATSSGLPGAESKSASLVEALQKRDEQLAQRDSEIRDLKEQIKRLQENQKDYKNLLEIYKSTSVNTTNNGSSNSKSASTQPQPGSPNSTNASSSSSSGGAGSGSGGGGSGSSGKLKNIELEEAKVEIKRLNSIIEKLKAASSGKSAPVPITSPSAASSTHHHHHHDDDKAATSSSSSSSGPVSNNQTVSSSSSTTQASSSSSATSSSSSSSSSQASPAVLNDYIKRHKAQEERIMELHKALSNKKQEEAALLNDMEITGQAYEEMQEQNIRLMQQLREKDDANFKLVSERIKLENVQKILKEEKEIFAQQIATLQEQHENQMNVSKKLEEQLAYLTQTASIYEKEIHQLQQTCEIYKRQAVDNVQLIQDLKLNTQKYLCQLKEAQQQVAEKSESLAAQAFSSKRAQEEIKQLQSKLERQKKFEMASNMDEVLKEEIKEYKEQLRCPSCKVKDKDAVLTKCFHVFCFDCLQKRYDTRQRKCPKCNANFGANDFRKLYLS